MGIESLIQQNAGLAGTNRVAGNAMYPQSQMDKTQYAVSSQMPTSAAVMKSDYDPLTDPLSGTLTEAFAHGGIASIPRYDGEEGSQVETPVNPVLTNPDFKNLDLSEENLPALSNLYALKETDPKAYNSGLMSVLSAQLKDQYNKNADYEPTWHQLKSLEKTDPAQWHREQLGWLGHHQGWQIGSNTSYRNAAEMPVIQDEIEQARKAGLKDDEIQQILSSSEQSANYQNQRRIAQDEASAKGGNFGELAKVTAPLALSMVAAPYLAPMLGGGLTGAMAAGALTGGATAGITGGDVGRGILMGGATGAAGGALNGIDPSVAQGINVAKNAYSLSQNPNNPMAAINAFKGVSSMAPVSAAQGGLMASGGITTLGSYSDGGRLLKGPGDGMSDNIPATISNKQPARLADGEFVIPADVVSHLGNGSTDAGAKQLYKMMDRIRHARTGNKKQGKRINPNKFLPKG